MLKAHSEQEFNNTRIAASCGIRVPEALDYIELDGRFGIVFERITGASLMKLLSNPLLSRKYTKVLAALQYQMHRKTSDSLPRYKDLLAGSIERAPLLSPDEKQQVLKYLDALPDGKAVCHGDFHPDNILMTKDGPVIMDWMTICIGDPAADVARTLLMMTTAELPESVPGWAKRLLNMARQNITKAYYQEYLRLSGLERSAAEQWTLPLAAARLNERRPAQEAEMLHAMVTTMLAHT